MRRRSDRADASGFASGARIAVAAGLLAVLGALEPGARAGAAGPLPVPEAARTRLLALGPWPSATPPSTAADRAATALGEQLFHSPRLAERGAVRCASCHQPWRDFSDGRARALGLAEGNLNTPSLWNVSLHRRFGLDGARDALWRQALRPLADPREMPASAAHVARLLREDATLASRYAQAFGTAVPNDDEQALAGAGQALAAYLATLRSPSTPFDAWRDALQADPAAPAPSAAVRRGALLFVGRGQCDVCHAGPAFSDDRVHATPDASGVAPASPAPSAIRTPGLRQVANTAPYMHDGRIERLCDAVRPHTREQSSIPLTGADRSDLVAFLDSLTIALSNAAPASCDDD